MANLAVFPDAELVISAWMMSIPNFPVYADYQLPWDINEPLDNGYIQVTVINGAPDQNVPLFHTVAQIDCWVNAPSEDRYYRLQASGMAKAVQYAAYDRKKAKRGLTLTTALSDGRVIEYPPAHMDTVVCLTEPHRIQSKDNYIFEGYSMDMTFTWTCGIPVN